MRPRLYAKVGHKTKRLDRWMFCCAACNEWGSPKLCATIMLAKARVVWVSITLMMPAHVATTCVFIATSVTASMQSINPARCRAPARKQPMEEHRALLYLSLH